MNKKLILGTVQFGLNYGVNNALGKPSEKGVEEILSHAYKQGIEILDTADAYGDATKLIGDYHQNHDNKFNVITKFKDISESEIEKWVTDTLEKLQIPSLFACLFHSTTEYLNNPNLIKGLTHFYNQGLIKNIGVSIYTNEQFEKVIHDPSVQLIQLPYNLLDNSNQRDSLIKKAKNNNKIIHVRSVFLQGLFFMDLDKLPQKLKPLKPELEYLQQLTQKYNIPMQTLALKYVASNPDIDGILIGVDNIYQLQANTEAINRDIPQSLLNKVNNISTQYIELLNPVNWA
jgi:uncharacterized protein